MCQQNGAKTQAACYTRIGEHAEKGQRALMPTIDRKGPFRVVIYPNDHDPSHVHVISGDGVAIFNLSNPDVELREVHGMRDREVARAFDLVRRNRETYLTAWKNLHGE